MDSFAAQPPLPRDLLVWQHVVACLRAGVPVTLLLVVHSEGSSPGRQGFKMSVAGGSMVGSIGGGIMEHKLVELARDRMLRQEQGVLLREQIHRGEVARNRSGMICSGSQTVVLMPLQPTALPALHTVIKTVQELGTGWLRLRSNGELLAAEGHAPSAAGLVRTTTYPDDWHYTEALGFRDQLTIVGGGHVALALSRVAATLDFRITVLDDRPGLNTLLMNPYAHEKRTVDYHHLREAVAQGPHQYAVIMTFGYRSDDVAVRQLLGHSLAYLGLLGSEAKIEQMLADLRADGFPEDQIARIYTPVGLPIHSRTPEEIAISIAAEIIRTRNEPYGDAR